MELLARIDESEVAATFVRGELESPRFREDVLAGRRGWRARSGVERASLGADEVLAIRYINWDWWLRVSNGTRSAVEAARQIRAGMIPGIDGESHLPIVERLRSGAPLPELIAEGREGDPLVLVEGHARLTAFALYPECLPDVLHVLVGFSERVDDWWAY